MFKQYIEPAYIAVSKALDEKARLRLGQDKEKSDIGTAGLGRNAADKQRRPHPRFEMRPVWSVLSFLLPDAAGDHLPRRSVPEEQPAYLHRQAIGQAYAVIS